MSHLWHEHMTTSNVFYGKFSDARMATLVVKHDNFLFEWQVSVFSLDLFSFRMTTLVVKTVVGAGVLHATRVALII